MRIKLLWPAVATGSLALAGAIGMGSYLAGYQEGKLASRDFIRGYTILTPVPIRARRLRSSSSKSRLASS